MNNPKYYEDRVYWGRTVAYATRNRGPALIWGSGNLQFCNEGWLFCRKKGPALVYHNGEIIYCIDDKLHRTDGPARIYPDGTKEYRVYSKKLEPMEFFAIYGTI